MTTKFLRLFSLISLFSALFVFSTAAQNTRPNFNRQRSYDVQHYVLRVSFNRKNKQIFGDTTVRFKPLSRDFEIVELDAVDLDFETVKLEPSGQDLNFRAENGKIFVNLDKKYDPQDLISLRFKYSAKPAKGIYFVEEVKKREEITFPSQIWTQGEAQEARHWFPSFDFPSDKATSEQFITAEKDETVIGNGELLEIVANANGTKTFHYKMDIPHSTYLTSFVVGTYKKIEDKYKEIPLGYYVYPNKTLIVPKVYGKTKNMMRIFEELTNIKYPYNKYDQTMVADFHFGGMENITATTMSDRELMLADYGFGANAVEDLVSHELAHSWFGNLVTCKNWAELWLNEGFATFMEAAYREKMYGRADYLRKIKENAGEAKIADAVAKSRHALFNLSADPEDESLFDTTTYSKGGAVIHILRETVGDEAFWKGVNLYLTRNKFGNVETEDLQKALEESSKMDLGWFFDQWIYSAGYPKLLISSKYDKTSKTLHLKITQTQKADDLTPAVFRLPLDVELQTNGGTKSEKIEVNQREQTFSIKLDAPMTKIRIDKNSKIPLLSIQYSK